MARYTRGSHLALVTIVAVSFFSLAGCSDSINSPLSLDRSTDLAGFPGAKDPSSGNTLNGDTENARDSRILHTRSGEFVTTSDLVLRFQSDAIPANVDPHVIIKDPTLFMFDVEPEGTVLNSPIQITLDYSRADLEGIDEGSLTVCQITGGHLSPIPTIVDGSGNLVSFKITEFARYALARD